MAPLRRADQHGARRKPVLAALVAGMLFGLLIAGVRLSGPSTSSISLPDDSASEASQQLQDQLRSLETRVQTLKSERDAARRQLTDTEQQHRDLEARLATVEASARSAATGAAAQSGTCIDRHAPWQPSAERDKEYPELAAFLRKVAINNEVIVAVSNINYAWPGGMLEVWMKNVQRSGVKNAMVLALDDQTKANVEAFGLPAFRMDMVIPDSQKESGSNHAVSALKFRILTPFIKLGYGVLLSDVDIVTLQNPFDHLVRDSDVESLSDGWSPETAYGYNDVADDESMGWARYAHSMRIFVFNSGLFYLRPTIASLDLLEKVVYRVETENGWDQALFNECIFFPNSPNNKDPAVTRRTMDMYKFMNSKTLFKHLRHNPPQFKEVKPVMVHVNYHPDKFERMKAVVKLYVDGDKNALDKFPDGSE